MAAPPAEVEVNPGKLTIMLGDFGNERFHGTFTGLGHDYGRIVHDFLTSDNERKEIVPGIATEWNLSTDGLTWTWTIRKGVKWHDGSEVTPEDVLWTLDHMIGPGAHEYGTVSAYILRSKLTEKIELSGPDSVSLTSTRPLPEMAVMTSRAGPNYFPILPKRAIRPRGGGGLRP
jgi:ABC-type transport system substrate-binding protein